MQRGQRFQLLRLRELRRVGAGGKLGLLDLLCRRDPAHHAEQVVDQPGHGQTKGQRKDPKPQPLLFIKHPKALFQQHGGGKIAHCAAQQQADQQEGPVLRLLKQQKPEKPAQHQTAAQGKAPLDHRPQRRHRDHIAGTFRGPPAVKQKRQQAQRQRSGSIGQKQRILQIPGGSAPAGSPIALAAQQQPHRRRKKGQRSGQGGDAPEKQHGDLPGEQLAEGDAEVQDPVKHRQRRQVAREHGGKGADGEEKKLLQAAGSQPEEDRLAQSWRAGRRRAKEGKQGDQSAGQQGKAQPRQPVGKKQALPGDGKGMVQAGAAGGEKVAPHRHGADEPISAGEQQTGGLPQREHHAAGAFRLPGHGRQIAGKAQHMDQTDGQQQRPERQITGPDRPEAGQILADHRPAGLTAEFPGHHAPHLPARK